MKKMVRYANTTKEAKKIASQMKKEDSEHATDVRIEETFDDGFGIYGQVSKGKYVIHNETE